MHPSEKASKKPTKAEKDSHGKGWPSAAALKQMLEWVSGSAYKPIFNAKGTWFTEKKVPPRNVIGSNIRLLKVAMSS